MHASSTIAPSKGKAEKKRETINQKSMLNEFGITYFLPVHLDMHPFRHLSLRLTDEQGECQKAEKKDSGTWTTSKRHNEEKERSQNR